MYEVWTGNKPYDKNINSEMINRGKERPEFPETTDPEYVSLAKECWVHNRKERPAFGDIIPRLLRIQRRVNFISGKSIAYYYYSLIYFYLLLIRFLIIYLLTYRKVATTIDSNLYKRTCHIKSCNLIS